MKRKVKTILALLMALAVVMSCVSTEGFSVFAETAVSSEASSAAAEGTTVQENIELFSETEQPSEEEKEPSGEGMVYEAADGTEESAPSEETEAETSESSESAAVTSSETTLESKADETTAAESTVTETEKATETVTENNGAESSSAVDETKGENTESATEAITSAAENSANSLSPNAITESRQISGPTEVAIGETIKLTGTDGWSVSKHRWSFTSDNGGEVEITPEANRSSVRIRGVKAGNVTITHSYTVNGILWSENRSESYKINVVEKLSEGEFPLYIYTLIPGVEEGSSDNADRVWNGMGVGTITNNGLQDADNYAVNTIIDNGYGNSGAVIDYATDGYPQIQGSDGKWYTYAEKGSSEANLEGYYTVDWLRVIVANGANAGNNGRNPVVKDKESGGKYTFHLDGVVTLNEANMYTVHFHLQDAGESDFAFVDPETYSRRVPSGFHAKDLTRPEVNDPQGYPDTKTVDGIIYQFDGWYTDENCTQAVDWENAVITSNTDYYARYIPITQTLTVKKDVTGSLGDLQKKFEFHYRYQDASNNEIAGTFQLSDGEETSIENVPVGVTLYLSETNADGYETTCKYGDTTNVYDGTEKNMQIKVTSTASEIIVTNDKDAIPDTDITLDSMPYTLMLLLAVTGITLFAGRRRRRNYN